MPLGKIHYRSRALYVNAGMTFPLCYAGARLLDTDKGRLRTTGDLNAVTCKHCRRATLKTWPYAGAMVERIELPRF